MRNMGAFCPAQDNRFTGRGRTLGSTQGLINPDLSLQARLLDNSSPDHPLDTPSIGTREQLSDGRQSAVDNAVAAGHQVSVISDKEIQQLVSMGFDKTQVEVALAAADGDLNIAVEILMSQQG
ncbi:hypothetical protein Patl1_32838 [Pistacia atlantica]|uniref:Uncharacterized protein n=1 Tax=Pistacia atlantica TaxID=434234 RepID=A0ACC1AMN2_9ROSI|nr:hypothetical protein Patl1_32838 [Pistacia atlantica]